VKKEKKPRGGAVCVKKKFDTSELLQTGFKNVEIILLPGNSSSGVLKREFKEENFMLNDSGFFGTTKNTDDEEHPPEKDRVRMGDFYAGMIGVVFATVSIIVAICIELTLTYKIRVYGWLILLTFTTFRWLRIFAMNKIISLEPCGGKNSLYRFNQFSSGQLTSCRSGNTSSNERGTYYVTMLDSENRSDQTGIFSNDESFAVSFLSDDPRLRPLA